jgi:hypothetical protein
MTWQLRKKPTTIKKVGYAQPSNPLKSLKPLEPARPLKPQAPLGYEYYWKD